MNSKTRASERRGKPAEKARIPPPGRQRRPIFVINLKQDAKRLAFMKRQLDDMNLEFEVIEAVDGRAVPEEERRKMTAGSLQCILPNELGCHLSHRKVHQTMAERNISEALILEDDALLNEDFAEVVNGCELPEECRILQLTAKEPNGGYELERLELHLSSRTLPLPRGYRMGCYIGMFYCSHAYILRLSYARRLAAETLPMKVRNDHSLFDWRHSLYLPWMAYKKGADGKCRTLGTEAPVADKRPENRFYRDLPEYEKILAQHELRMHVCGGGEWPARNKKRPPPVFVLNLEQGGDRLAEIKRELDRGGVPFEVVNAADHDGKNRVPGEAKPKNSSAECERRLAHLKAYRAALRSGAPEAVIFEDGALLDEDFPAWFHGKPLKRRRSGPGMTHYGQWHAPTQLFSPYQAKPLAHKYDPDFPADDDVVSAIKKFCAQAYIIQRPQMRKLLGKERTAAAPIEALLFHSRVRIFHQMQHRALTALTKAVQRFLLRCPALLNYEEKSVQSQFKKRPISVKFLKITLSMSAFPGLRRTGRDD